MLSAGVAHEINNPLAYVANNLAVLERDVTSLLCLIKVYEGAKDSLAGPCPETLAEIRWQSEACDLPYIQENLDKILASTRQGVKRVAEIVHNLRGFARLDRAAVDQVDVHEAMSTALEMIRGRLQRRHIAVVERKAELPPVAASPVQVNQVFLNLLVNAMQAIEATNREDGQIAIQTRCAGTDVIIEIADNGCGIPPEVLPQIFDPFFTTKSVGDGTGLGLSITHGIVQDHAGRMEVESTPGQGTCFRVILPVSRK
jgi:signal transduction histidine kinase